MAVESGRASVFLLFIMRYVLVDLTGHVVYRYRSVNCRYVVSTYMTHVSPWNKWSVSVVLCLSFGLLSLYVYCGLVLTLLLLLRGTVILAV